MQAIQSIHAPADGLTADVFCASGDAKYFETIRLANMPPDGQAAWTTALGYASASVLQPGESIRSIILEPLQDGVAVDVDESGNPTALRDLVTISLSINTDVQGGPAVRYQTLTSEDLPQTVRDGLLALYVTLRNLDRAALAALGVAA